jgi:predicted regulator of Ras-like GTPase activity (Roadblock/LC7/MglB family)
VLSGDALLLVLAQPNPNLGQLLFELRRNREHIAALV